MFSHIEKCCLHCMQQSMLRHGEGKDIQKHVHMEACSISLAHWHHICVLGTPLVRGCVPLLCLQDSESPDVSDLEGRYH